MTVPDFSDLPAPLRESLEVCLAAGRRFYIAWHPDWPEALLRHLDAAGLAEWESLAPEWKILAVEPPTIGEVTAAVPGLWRAVLLYSTHPREWIKWVYFTPPESLTLQPPPQRLTPIRTKFIPEPPPRVHQGIPVSVPTYVLAGLPMGSTKTLWTAIAALWPAGGSSNGVH